MKVMKVMKVGMTAGTLFGVGIFLTTQDSRIFLSRFCSCGQSAITIE